MDGDYFYTVTLSMILEASHAFVASFSILLLFVSRSNLRDQTTHSSLLIIFTFEALHSLTLILWCCYNIELFAQTRLVDGAPFCLLIGYFNVTTVVASSLAVLYTSLERYVSLLRPLEYKAQPIGRIASLAFGCVLIYSMCFSGFIFLNAPYDRRIRSCDPHLLMTTGFSWAYASHNFLVAIALITVWILCFVQNRRNVQKANEIPDDTSATNLLRTFETITNLSAILCITFAVGWTLNALLVLILKIVGSKAVVMQAVTQITILGVTLLNFPILYLKCAEFKDAVLSVRDRFFSSASSNSHHHQHGNNSVHPVVTNNSA